MLSSCCLAADDACAPRPSSHSHPAHSPRFGRAACALQSLRYSFRKHVSRHNILKYSRFHSFLKIKVLLMNCKFCSMFVLRWKEYILKLLTSITSSSCVNNCKVFLMFVWFLKNLYDLEICSLPSFYLFLILLSTELELQQCKMHSSKLEISKSNVFDIKYVEKTGDEFWLYNHWNS